MTPRQPLAISDLVGLAYDRKRFDCVDFTILVQREVFGRDVSLDMGRPRGRRGQYLMGGMSRQFAAPTDAPKDGDLVLMYDRGVPAAHCGTYFFRDYQGWVLHVGSGLPFSCFTRVADLPMYGAPIEGFYSWLPNSR